MHLRLLVQALLIRQRDPHCRQRLVALPVVLPANDAPVLEAEQLADLAVVLQPAAPAPSRLVLEHEDLLVGVYVTARDDTEILPGLQPLDDGLPHLVYTA